ncbi:hypothetical protein PG993_008765 [Apiospora rasikravindrae]|uniref:Uncharacterized protein n=1 Tax=Apiospora rasikravindrae TaxID=990691 RepID=A0ABR1SP91_9PEZI
MTDAHGVHDKDTADPHPSYGIPYGTRGDQARKTSDAQSTNDFPGGTYYKKLHIPATIEDNVALAPHDQRHSAALAWVNLIRHDPEDHSGGESQAESRSEAKEGTYLPSNEKSLAQLITKRSETTPESLRQLETVGNTMEASGIQSPPHEAKLASKGSMSFASDRDTGTIKNSRSPASSTDRGKRSVRPIIIQQPQVSTQVAAGKRNRERVVVYHGERERREFRRQRIPIKLKGSGSPSPRITYGKDGDPPPTIVGESQERIRHEQHKRLQDIQNAHRSDEKPLLAFEDPVSNLPATSQQPVISDSVISPNPKSRIPVLSENASKSRGSSCSISEMLLKCATSAGTSVQSSPGQPAYSETSTEEPNRSAANIPPIVGASVPILRPGTKLFLLMCVNTGPFQIKLSQVELTTVGNDETLFRQIREAYNAMRGPLMRNPFRIAKNVEYVKFDLIHRHKSGECVGNYQTNSIPTLKEVMQREYAFSPCPPLIGPMPIRSHLFMHSFLNPGDHSGSTAVKQLPKKVGKRLRCTSSQPSDPSASPFGWGIYMVEGLNTTLVVWLLGAGLLATFLFTTVWTVANNDIQSGMGIGQFALAFLALLLTTAAVKESNTLPAFG